MRDGARPWLAFVVVTLMTIIGLAGLAQLKFSAFLADSVGERLEIVATTVARDFGSAIDLGLRVAAVANSEQILERARNHDPSIGAIAVFDLDGTVLHAIGDVPPAGIHDQTHEAFRIAILEGSDDWSVEADGLIRSGAVIEGSFGQPVAGVVVHYPVTEMREQEAAMLGSVLLDATWIGALALVVTGAAFVLLRSRSRPDQGESGA